MVSTLDMFSSVYALIHFCATKPHSLSFCRMNIAGVSVAAEVLANSSNSGNNLMMILIHISRDEINVPRKIGGVYLQMESTNDCLPVKMLCS
jgi:hypothetical protein